MTPASLIVLYDVKEFMDALELMMNAVGIPFDVPNLASVPYHLNEEIFNCSPINLSDVA